MGEAQAITKLPRAEGQVDVGFKRRGSATVIADLYQQGCAKARFPGQPSGSPFQAVLINTSGGLTDDDHFQINIDWGHDCSAIVTSQAAERIYKSRGGNAKVEATLTVAPDATAVWLPQETLLFDQGRCARRMTVDLASNSHFLAMDALVLGRSAMQERVSKGYWLDRWRIRRDGKLIFADGFLLDDRRDGDIQRTLAKKTIANACQAIATGLVVSDCAVLFEAAVRSVLSSCDVFGGVSRVGSVLFWRFMSPDASVLRATSNQVFDALISLEASENPFSTYTLPRVFNC